MGSAFIDLRPLTDWELSVLESEIFRLSESLFPEIALKDYAFFLGLQEDQRFAGNVFRKWVLAACPAEQSCDHRDERVNQLHYDAVTEPRK